MFSCSDFNRVGCAALLCDLWVPSKHAEQGPKEAWAGGTEQPDLSWVGGEQRGSCCLCLSSAQVTLTLERVANFGKWHHVKQVLAWYQVSVLGESAPRRSECAWKGREKPPRSQSWLMLASALRTPDGKHSWEMAGNINLKQDNQRKWAFKNSFFSQTFQNRPSFVWVVFWV